MTSSPLFEIDIDRSETTDDRRVMLCRGELDLASASRLLQELATGSRPNQRVILDLSRVTFIDASGVRAILDAAEILSALGGLVEIRRPSERVRRVFDIIGMEDLMNEIHPEQR